MKPDSYDLKRNIGVVFQNVAVFDTLTVQENIDYFCGLYIKNKAERKRLVRKQLTLWDLRNIGNFIRKSCREDFFAG